MTRMASAAGHVGHSGQPGGFRRKEMGRMKAWIPALIAAGAGTAAAATLSLSGSFGVAPISRAIAVVSGTAMVANQ